jgi:uncharacterized cupin superfamily protein
LTATDMQNTIIKVTPSDLELEIGAFPAEWVLSGNPEMRSKLLFKTPDWLVHVVAWECGAVSYKWHYANDEAYVVISGEGFMTNENGEERRFAAGDVAFFSAGTSATWRHPDHFKKIAFLTESVGRPVGFLIKAFCKLLRVTGIKGRRPSFLLLALIALVGVDRG